MYTTTYKTCAI